MRQVKIRKGTIGLVFKNEDFEKIIDAGKYWLKMKQEVIIYNLFEEFHPPQELDLLLKSKELAKRLKLVTVKDNEIALQFEKGMFKKVLRTGRYTFWNEEMDFSFKIIDLTDTNDIESVNLNLLLRPELLLYVRLFIIEPFEKGVLLVNGEFQKILRAGTYRFWRNAVTIDVQKVDMRQQQLEIAGQEILTKDKAALRVNFFIHFKVVQIKSALIENKKFMDQLYILMQFALREFIGTLTLDELLEKKDEIGEYILLNFAEKAIILGVELKSVGIRDIILPGEIKEIMNQVLVAQKRAQANIITRREETASTRSLLNTAKLMEDNTMLFKLKEMEYVEKIAEKIGEIKVNGNSSAVDQLKQIFTPNTN